MEGVTQSILIAIESLINVIDKKQLPYEDLRLIDDKLCDLKDEVYKKELQFAQYWEDL